MEPRTGEMTRVCKNKINYEVQYEPNILKVSHFQDIV